MMNGCGHRKVTLFGRRLLMGPGKVREALTMDVAHESHSGVEPDANHFLTYPLPFTYLPLVHPLGSSSKPRRPSNRKRQSGQLKS